MLKEPSALNSITKSSYRTKYKFQNLVGLVLIECLSIWLLIGLMKPPLFVTEKDLAVHVEFVRKWRSKH